MRIITETEYVQLEEKYTAYELVDLLGLDTCEILDAFENEVEDKINTLLDKERGIGL